MVSRIYLHKNNKEVYIDSYILNVNTIRPAIIVCPGGGYGKVSEREAEQVAMQFLAKGYHAFVLKYSIAPAKYPSQLIELATSMKIIRENSKVWKINKNEITVLGFSAGGHLAGSLAVHWDKEIIKKYLGVENEYIKPNASILAYPVITTGEFAHEGSFNNLIGDDKELREFLSLEKQIGEHVAPIFLWHTVTDQVVPVENTMLMGIELRKHNIPFEMHIYDKGVHGLSLCNRLTSEAGENHLQDDHIGTWINLVFEWLDRIYNKEV